MSSADTRSRTRIPLLLTGFMLIAFGFSFTASASVITDIPQGVNEALFDGRSLFAAKTILTAAIMMSAGLVLAVARLNPMGIFIVLICVLGSLTAIGWAEVSYMVAAIFIAAGLFAKEVFAWWGEHSAGKG